MTNRNDTPKAGHVDPATRTPANAEPTSGKAPPVPAPEKHVGTLPNASVPPAQLEKDSAAGLATKGLPPK